MNHHNHLVTFDKPMQTLCDYAADLSPQLQYAAMLLKMHQRDTALLSIWDLARRCGPPPAAFSRLARALDFDDFATLCDIYVNHLRQ